MIVALSGYYGFANTGDEAILLAIARELTRLGHAPLVLSDDPDATARHFGVRAAHRMKPFEVLRAVAGCDALLSGGGGLLQDKTSRRNLRYYVWIIRLARMMGKRVAVFNQSIGPLSPDGERTVASALRRVKAIVRDSGSLELLRRIGVSATLGGDPALLLEPPDLPRDENLVILAPRGGQRAATERLVRLAARLEAAGRRVMALSLQPGVDTPEIEMFKAVTGAKLEETADPSRALELIASAGAVVGVRLHAVILGAAVGTPFYGIDYDPKVAGFCADANAVHVGVDFDANALANDILERRHPDWDAVAAMRDRARESFKLALE